MALLARRSDGRLRSPALPLIAGSRRRRKGYASKAAAQGGVASVQANAPRDERYLLDTASDGRPYFNLRAANSQVIGTFQMYTTEGARTTGIESVKANGASADVRKV